MAWHRIGDSLLSENNVAPIVWRIYIYTALGEMIYEAYDLYASLILVNLLWYQAAMGMVKVDVDANVCVC